MIAPALDSGELAARLDRMPSQLRTALADALDQALRSSLAPHASVTIDTTADTITATLRTAVAPPASRATARHQFVYRRGRRGFAENAMALQPHRRLRVLRGTSASSAVSGFSFSDIRAPLIACATEALSR